MLLCDTETLVILRVEVGQLSVLLVPGSNLVNTTAGLYGTYDDNPANDLLLSNGTLQPTNSTPQAIYYGFGESCKHIALIHTRFPTSYRKFSKCSDDS